VAGAGTEKVPRRLLLLAAAALLAACASVPRDESAGGGPASTVYVIHRGWHTDIAFAARDLSGPLAAVAHELGDAKYLVIGFGDRRYLESRGPGAGLLALWPGQGLMLGTGLAATPQQAFGAERVAQLRLSPERARAVEAFVWHSFRPDADGAVRSEAPGPYPGSRFYPASPRYSGLHTCNAWTAEALQAGGVPVHSAGVIFSWQLWAQLPRPDAAD
jgi:uncharacterized protein (TIGR02117 family)